MNKKDILKVLDIAGLLAVVLATLLVLIFEFTGTSLLVKYAIAFYTTGFAIATVYFSIMTYDAFKTKKEDNVKQENNLAETENSNIATNENTSLKQNSKVTIIVKLVLSALALIFTAIVLFLY